MIEINKFPVVIFANYRTGSSALGYHLSQKYNLICFLEPARPILFPNLGPNKHGVALDFYNFYHFANSDRFLVKFMPDQINDLNPYKNLLSSDSSFKIKLTRENKVDQIASMYIGKKRNKFWKSVEEPNREYIVDIDYNVLVQSISMITNQDFMLKNLNIEYDYECTYESLGYMPNNINAITDQPKNINEIRQEILKIIDGVPLK